MIVFRLAIAGHADITRLPNSLDKAPNAEHKVPMRQMGTGPRDSFELLQHHSNSLQLVSHALCSHPYQPTLSQVSRFSDPAHPAIVADVRVHVHAQTHHALTSSHQKHPVGAQALQQLRAGTQVQDLAHMRERMAAGIRALEARGSYAQYGAESGGDSDVAFLGAAVVKTVEAVGRMQAAGATCACPMHSQGHYRDRELVLRGLTPCRNRVT